MPNLKIEGLTESRRLGKLCPQGHEFNGTGKSLRTKKNWQCVECLRARSKTPSYKQYQRCHRKRNTANTFLNRFRKLAKKEGVEFSLSNQWVRENLPQKCPILLISITPLVQSVKSPYDAMIVRVNPELGFIDGNCQIISRRAMAQKQAINRLMNEEE
jgi:hypothetical protein